jgi:predicted dehydrogenase
MNIAIVGCGYVAEQYAATLPFHPELRLVGAYDTNAERLATFARRYQVAASASLPELAATAGVELMLNLTSPRAHYSVTRTCLAEGKHVYSEKPLGMTTDEARQLAAMAEQRNLFLGSAPCNVLGEAAQTLWHAVRHGLVGQVRLVYANFDDGMIAPHLAPWTWTNDAGVPWPAKDEFEVGSTYQHAGYVLTWLCAMFGPARRVHGFASVLVRDKGIAVDAMAPDFTVGCLEFDAGVVARVTCGLTAPRDKSMTVVGDKGTLMVGNVRDDAAPVMWRPATEQRLASIVRRRLPVVHRWLQARLSDAGVSALFAHPVPPRRRPAAASAAPGKRVDFLRGPSEMAEAITSGRRSRVPADFAVHIVEIVERLQYPERFSDRSVNTAFAPIEPMPWAL